MRKTYVSLYKKMKFSIKDLFNKSDQSEANCGFGNIY